MQETITLSQRLRVFEKPGDSKLMRLAAVLDEGVKLEIDRDKVEILSWDHSDHAFVPATAFSDEENPVVCYVMLSDLPAAA